MILTFSKTQKNEMSLSCKTGCHISHPTRMPRNHSRNVYLHAFALTRIFHEKTTSQKENIIISNGYNKKISYFENAKCKSTFAV